MSQTLSCLRTINEHQRVTVQLRVDDSTGTKAEQINKLANCVNSLDGASAEWYNGRLQVLQAKPRTQGAIYKEQQGLGQG